METSHVKLLPGKPERPASAEMTGSRTVQRLVSLAWRFGKDANQMNQQCQHQRGTNVFLKESLFLCQIKSDEALSNCQNLQACTIPQSNSLYTRGLSICRPC